MAVTISMVALGNASKISAGGICKAWGARWPKAPQPTGAGKKGSVLSFRVGEHEVFYGLMPAPIPWTDLEGPCATSPFWPNAATTMRTHQRHVIVTATGDADGPALAETLTRATSALVESSDGVVGVFWCNSGLVFPPKGFCQIASKFGPGEPALPIWVNFRVAKNKDENSAGFTQGLSSLGKMEFETQGAPESPEALRDRFLHFAAYVLDGAAIKDGETIGFDANEKIKVTHAASSFGVPGPVMRLDFSAGNKNGGGVTAYGYVHLLTTIICMIAFGFFLYSIFPFLRGSIFRHFVLVPATLLFGFLFLLISEQMLERALWLANIQKVSEGK